LNFKKHIGLILFLIANQSYSIEIVAKDSLFKIEKYKQVGTKILYEFDLNKWNNSNKIAHQYVSKNNIILETLNYYKRNTNQLRIIALLEYIIGFDFYLINENPSKAILYFKKVDKLNKYLSLNEKFDLYNSWANAEKLNYNYNNSIIIFNKSLELAKQFNNKRELFRSYIGIGMIYSDLGFFNLSEKNLLLAKNNISKNYIDDYDEKYWLSIHLLKLYRQKKEYSKALKIIQDVSNIKNRNIEFNKGFFEREKALFYYKIKNIDSASYYCSKLILNKEKKYSNHNRVVANLTFGKICQEKKDFINAIRYYENTIAFAQKLNADTEGFEATILLLKLIKNYKQFNKYYKYLEQIEKKKNAFNKDSKLFVLKLEKIKNAKQFFKNKNKYKNIYVVIVLLFNIVLLFSIYRFIKIKKNYKKILQKKIIINQNTETYKKLNLQLSQLNLELEQFSTIIAHDIKSSLVTIIYLAKDYHIFEDKNKKISQEIQEIEEESQKLYFYIDALLSKEKKKKI